MEELICTTAKLEEENSNRAGLPTGSAEGGFGRGVGGRGGERGEGVSVGGG